VKIGDLVRFNLRGLEMYLGIVVGRNGVMWEVLWNGYSLPSSEYASHLELVNAL